MFVYTVGIVLIFSMLDTSRRGAVELNFVSKQMYLARDMVNSARELLISDSEVFTPVQAHGRLQAISAQLREVLSSLRSGDATVHLPAADKSASNKEGILYGWNDDAFAYNGDEYANLRAQGVNEMLFGFLEAADVLLHKFNTSAAGYSASRAPGTNLSALMQDQHFRLMYDLEAGPLGKGLAKAVAEYMTTSITWNSFLQSLISYLLFGFVLETVFMYKLVYKVAITTVTTEMSRRSDMLQLIPKHMVLGSSKLLSFFERKNR